jgi:hypothetical protein
MPVSVFGCAWFYWCSRQRGLSVLHTPLASLAPLGICWGFSGIFPKALKGLMVLVFFTGPLWERLWAVDTLIMDKTALDAPAKFPPCPLPAHTLLGSRLESSPCQESPSEALPALLHTTPQPAHASARPRPAAGARNRLGKAATWHHLRPTSTDG